MVACQAWYKRSLPRSYDHLVIMVIVCTMTPMTILYNFWEHPPLMVAPLTTIFYDPPSLHLNWNDVSVQPLVGVDLRPRGDVGLHLRLRLRALPRLRQPHHLRLPQRELPQGLQEHLRLHAVTQVSRGQSSQSLT